MSRTPLNAFCALTMGQSPDSESYNIEHNGFPFYQGNADFGRIHPMVRVWCSAPKKLAKAGDILISVRAPIGALNIADCDCCIGRGLAAITPDATCADTMFLFYALYASAAELQRRGTGSTFKAISKNALSNLLLPSYCLEEQKEISAVLQQVDHLISLRQRQAEKLDELVKARFVEMFGGAYSEVIAEDVCEKIVDCPHSTPKYNESELKYPAIRTSEIQDGQIEWSSMKYVGINEYQRRVKRLIPEAGDIVYAREGTYGDCVILPEGYQFCLGQRTMLFRPNYKLCNSEYLHAVLRSAAVKYQADMSNAGSTVPHVNVSDAKRFHFPLPPLPLQNAFATFVHEVDCEKERIQRSAALLKTLRRSLMQQYFG